MPRRLILHDKARKRREVSGLVGSGVWLFILPSLCTPFLGPSNGELLPVITDSS